MGLMSKVLLYVEMTQGSHFPDHNGITFKYGVVHKVSHFRADSTTTNKGFCGNDIIATRIYLAAITYMNFYKHHSI